jgi:hypothetical protein
VIDSLIALVRSGNAPALVLLDPRASAASVVAEGLVLGHAWAPGTGLLAYQREGDLFLYHPDGRSETLLSALPHPVRRTFAFNPQGDGIAVLADGALFLLPVLDSFPTGRRVPLPADRAPVDVTWFRAGSAVAVSCQTGERRSLLLFDLAAGGLQEVLFDGDLLGARRSDDRLVVRRLEPASGEEEACVLDDDGTVMPLFRVPAGLFISAYLPGPDLFLLAESSEDAGDPTSLQLVMPGGLPGQPWLEEFPNLVDWTFTPDGSLLTGVNRSDPDDPGELIVARIDRGPVVRMALASFAQEDEAYERPAAADLPSAVPAVPRGTAPSPA